jgi:hypothetical protein
MNRNGSWGTNNEIMAAAACFDVFIVVHQPHQRAGYEFACYGNESQPTVFLQNLSESHYEWMRPE